MSKPNPKNIKTAIDNGDVEQVKKEINNLNVNNIFDGGVTFLANASLKLIDLAKEKNSNNSDKKEKIKAIIKYLLDQGADPLASILYNNNRIPLYKFIIDQAESLDNIFQLFTGYIASRERKYSITEEELIKLMLYAVLRENVEALTALLKQMQPGYSIDKKTILGTTLLYSAAEECKNLEIIKLLLNHGANPDLLCTVLLENYKATPLFIAVNAMNVEFVKTMLPYCKNVNIVCESSIFNGSCYVTQQRVTPLLFAMNLANKYKPLAEIADLLIENDADPTIEGIIGGAPVNAYNFALDNSPDLMGKLIEWCDKNMQTFSFFIMSCLFLILNQKERILKNMYYLPEFFSSTFTIILEEPEIFQKFIVDRNISNLQLETLFYCAIFLSNSAASKIQEKLFKAIKPKTLTPADLFNKRMILLSPKSFSLQVQRENIPLSTMQEETLPENPKIEYDKTQRLEKESLKSNNTNEVGRAIEFRTLTPADIVNKRMSFFSPLAQSQNESTPLSTVREVSLPNNPTGQNETQKLEGKSLKNSTEQKKSEIKQRNTQIYENTPDVMSARSYLKNVLGWSEEQLKAISGNNNSYIKKSKKPDKNITAKKNTTWFRGHLNSDALGLSRLNIEYEAYLLIDSESIEYEANKKRVSKDAIYELIKTAQGKREFVNPKAQSGLISFDQKDRFEISMSVIVDKSGQRRGFPAEMVGKVKVLKYPQRLGIIKIESDQNNETGRAPLYVVTGVIDNDDHMPSKSFQPKPLDLWRFLQTAKNKNKEEDSETSFSLKPYLN